MGLCPVEKPRMQRVTAPDGKPDQAHRAPPSRATPGANWHGNSTLVGAMAERLGFHGLLIDLSGTVYEGDAPIPGAVEAIRRFEAAGLPFRYVTNTTSQPRAAVLERIRGLGLDAEEASVLTPAAAAADRLRERGLRRCHFVVPPALMDDFPGFEHDEDAAQAVVMGDLQRDFTYAALDRAFRSLERGAPLIALAKNRCCGGDTLHLDLGPFVAALEYASGREAEIVGKPAPQFFRASARDFGLPPAEVAAVGDDLEGDVLGAMDAGLGGILVRTGKFRPEALAGAARSPDRTLDSLADLPSLLV